ncbi:MAG TPA: DUF5946 family protein [Mycobacteriales bacterium]|nr:DUF5946 family protein [Mycobacteriales bacterium]
MSPEWTVCPGCAVRLPAVHSELDRPLNASPACRQCNAEVVGFELRHPALIGRFHQLTVDTYGAQHGGAPTGRIYLGYSLVGLDLALERGTAGVEVRDIHQRMGRPDGTWPEFTPPPPAALTVLHVAEAGVRAGSVDGHARAMDEWAAAVWRSWAEQHDAVRALTDRVLAAHYRPRPRRRR